MKIVLTAAALMFAFPVSAKTWVDETCQVFFTSENQVFTYGTTDDRKKTTCVIGNWPISEPIGSLLCKDGTKPTIQLMDGDQVEIGGVTLFPAGDKSVICDLDNPAVDAERHEGARKSLAFRPGKKLNCVLRQRRRNAATRD